MSFDTFNDDNEKDPNKNSPYNSPQQPTPPNPGPPPFGGNTGSPYAGYQQPQQPQAGYGQPPQGGYNNPQQPGAENPYSYQAPQGHPQQGQGGGTEFMGLTWSKRVVPNPATNGAPLLSQKSVAVSYVLWFFLGVFGVHQFYLGNTSRGLFNLLLWGVTALLSITTIPFSFIFLAYWIYEAVTLNQQVEEINAGFIRKSIL